MLGRIGFVGIAAYCLFGASGAWALDTGQCLPAAQVRAELAAEGQNPIITGNRTGYGYKTALIFTANTDGSKGYAVRGDKPLGEPAETICIDSVYRDVRLNDVTRTGVPAWARLDGDRAKADAICKRDRLGYQELCGFYEDSITGLDRNGQHLMLMATGTAINPRDRTIREDQRITITLRTDENGGLVKAATPEGASYLLSAYTSASYSPRGEAMLAGR